MMRNEKKIIIIPVFNEAPTINKVLRKVNEHSEADILVIDDGSTDDSTSELNSVDRLNIISHTQNMGYGRSLMDGFEYAIENNYIRAVTIDCDDQHEPQMIPEFFEEAHKYDILSGSRYIKRFDTDTPAPTERKKINQDITNLINTITGYQLTDSFCGFKAYKVDILKKFSLTEQGYGMPLQLWIQAWSKGLTVKEKPVQRIYPDPNRTFGKELDDPETRLNYYKKIIDKELLSHRITLKNTENHQNLP